MLVIMKIIPLGFVNIVTWMRLLIFINAYLDMLTEEFHSRDGFESLLCDHLYVQRQEMWIVVPVINSFLFHLDLLSCNSGCFLTIYAVVTSSTPWLSGHECDLLSSSLADLTQAEAVEMPVQLGVPFLPLASHGNCVTSSSLHNEHMAYA